jgi:site-specific DNA-methyltransferase (cytosine-N4-specific)
MEDGWICRNDVVWHKPNHMPDSVKDRLTCSWEWVGHFTKQRKYYFNLDAIREPHKSLKTLPGGSKRNKTSESPNLTGRRLPPEPAAEGAFHELGKNPGDFWSLSPETRSLGAITGVRGAVKVPGGAGWQGHVRGGGARIVSTRDSRWLSPNGKNPGDMWEITTTHFKGAHFAVFPEQLCVRPILATCPPGGIVVDPFAGSGTVSVVARRLGRKYLLIDVNPDYCALARAHLKESGEC